MRLTMLLGAVALLSGRSAEAQDGPTGHDDAIAAIRKLGGEVKVDAQQAGAPVVVTLTGSRSPTECLPYLQHVNNLHTCDL
jgi:hypothetical protein